MLLIIFGATLLAISSNGFTIDDSSPLATKFSSLFALNRRQHQQMSADVVNRANEWKGFTSSKANSSNALLNEEERLLLERVSGSKPPRQQPDSVKIREETAHFVNGKEIEDIIKQESAKINPSSLLGLTDEDGNFDEDDNAQSSNLAKRQSLLTGRRSLQFPPNPLQEKIKTEESSINKLKTDLSCIRKLSLCAFNPLTSLECSIDCIMKTSVFSSDRTRFIYTLLKVLRPYAVQLCETYGSIYDKIQTNILESHHKSSLDSFLQAVGLNLADPTADLENFLIYGSQTLFNNMINHGISNDFQILEAVFSMAQTFWNAEIADLQQFPSTYTNPTCQQMPNHQWVVRIVEALRHHPVNADMFLRGYYVMSRGITQNMPYPIDNLFTSNVFALKMLTGVECSLITYAEQGTNFACLDPPQSENILADYELTEKNEDNPLKWLVCGAHQVEIPNWTQLKEQVIRENPGLTGRRSGGDGDLPQMVDHSDDTRGLPGAKTIVIDTDPEIPNPEETYYYLDNDSGTVVGPTVAVNDPEQAPSAPDDDTSDPKTE